MNIRSLLVLQAVVNQSGKKRDMRLVKAAISRTDKGDSVPEQLAKAITEMVRRRGLH
ncbi:hypothetical protein D3C87_823350 [compost metagenome]